ncbi:uncharacterized [Tachysurus ichikawai]
MARNLSYREDREKELCGCAMEYQVDEGIVHGSAARHPTPLTSPPIPIHQGRTGHRPSTSSYHYPSHNAIHAANPAFIPQD